MNISDSGFQFQRLSNQTVRQNQGVPASETKGEVSGNSKLAMAQEGQVFQGQILDVQGNQVSIRLQDNALLHARLGEQVGLNIGDELSFLIKENDGSNILIKPFFEGAEAMKDQAILKVLEGNNLSPSVKNYQIAETLMNHNMGVDKASMQKIMQQSYKYPDTSIDTLVSMNKLGLPVNESTIIQYEAYQNNQHQFMQGLQEFSNSMVEFASNEIMNLSSGEQGLLFQTDFLQVISDTQDMPNLSTANLNAMLNGEVAFQATEEQTLAGALGDVISQGVNLANPDESMGLDVTSSSQAFVSELQDKFHISTSVANGFVDGLENLGVSKEILNQVVAKSDSPLQLLNNVNALLQQISQSQGFDTHTLQAFFGSDSYKSIMGTAIRDKFSLHPNEMQEPKEVSDLYKSLYEKAEHLMERFGQSGGNAGHTMSEQAKSMQERIDFMQNLSELYAYAQLPVRVDGTDRNSDLYVYMNKKRLQENREDVSALLHLDMDYLGPTDVHVSLHGSTVHTRFYVEDALSAKIIDEHMNALEQAINENGFSLTNEVIQREKSLASHGNPVVEEMLGSQLEQSVKRYSFDVRT